MVIKKITEWLDDYSEVEMKRLQEAAVGLFPELPSRKSVKKAIKKGIILLNSDVGLTSSWVKIGDEISLKFNDKLINEADINKARKFDESDIAFEDSNIIVVIKRGGIITNGNYKQTLNRSVSKYLISKSLHTENNFNGPAHRLDKETHGPVIFYKNLEAANWLGNAFENRGIKKTYIAFVEGEMSLDKAIINIHVGGKTAMSEIERLGVTNWPLHGRATLVKVYPITGRKHQIRIHLSALGHPVIGDKLYNNGTRYTGSGLFLACTDISFTNVGSSEAVTIRCEPPRKFNKVLSKLDLP